MTHLPFVAASYALGVLVPAAYAVAAWWRMRLAQHRLAAIPRIKRPRRLQPADRPGPGSPR
jgi:hypothetical protein